MEVDTGASLTQISEQTPLQQTLHNLSLTPSDAAHMGELIPVVGVHFHSTSLHSIYLKEPMWLDMLGMNLL